MPTAARLSERNACIAALTAELGDLLRKNEKKISAAQDTLRGLTGEVRLGERGSVMAALDRLDEVTMPSFEDLEKLIRAHVLLPSVKRERDAFDASSLTNTITDKAKALRADTRWSPSDTDIQRGRRAMLQVFQQPKNLPLPAFAKLASKSRQQIYKDLAATPKRLLALNIGRRGQRLPDWQLDPLRLRLTQEVLKGAADVDVWTLFYTLSEPLDCLGGRSPVEAVTRGNFDEVLKAIYNSLGIH